MKSGRLYIKILFYCCIIILLNTACAHLLTTEYGKIQNIRRGTVKIITTSIRPIYNIPWKMEGYNRDVGSGALIEGNLILTNAHVVSDATYIEVQKENDPKKYSASVLYIGHDCDLALLKVHDDDFLIGTTTLRLSDRIPELKSTVATFGYPKGGNRISITEGVISRIETGSYSHSSYTPLLHIQTDAALNSGNSGGPVIQNENIVGIAFQIISSGENIGYLIPIPIIKHFLEDVSDNIYHGFPTLGVYWDKLENQSFRKYLGMVSNSTGMPSNSIGMGKNPSGILVNKVISNSSAYSYLKDGDVILLIDGIKIANDGSIQFEEGRISFSNLITSKQVGDTVQIEILREGKVIKQEFSLKKNEARIIWYNEYESLPRYFIFGGIIFQVLSREFLKVNNEWWYYADPLFLYYYLYHDIDDIYPEREEFVIINQVLPDPVNTYVSNISSVVVDTVNGIKITQLDDVIAAIEKPIGEYHIITYDNGVRPILLKATDIKEANKRILNNYRIPLDRRLNKYTGYGKNEN